jgi:putative acetyltransferase
MPLLIEPESVADVPAVRDVALAAFPDEPGVADLVEAIRFSPQYEPDLSLVARVDGRVAGFVMISHAELVEDGAGPTGETDAARRHDVLTLSPLAVAPDRQRRGIGAALVRVALAAADLAGAGLVTLEGSPRYYGRLGFRSAAEAGIVMHLPDWAPPEAAQVYLLRGYDPSARGRLVYPPAFDAVT